MSGTGSRLIEGKRMGRIFTGKDSSSWKVVTNAGKVLRYPADYPEDRKVGKPMIDLDGFKTANKLAQRYGGFAVRA